jgi:hypothetical protein
MLFMNQSKVYKYPQDFLLNVLDWMQIFISASSEIVFKWEEGKKYKSIKKLRTGKMISSNKKCQQNIGIWKHKDEWELIYQSPQRMLGR